jgi:AraC-like DNA-binding protein
MDFCTKKGGKNVKDENISRYHLNFNLSQDNHTKPIKNSHFCLIYLLEGAGFLKVEEEIYPLEVGQCFFQPAGVEFCYWSMGGKSWNYMWLLIDGPLFDEILPKTGFSIHNPVTTCTEEQRALLEAILARRYSYHGSEYYDTLGQAVRLMASFIATFPSEAQLVVDGSIKSIVNFINNNLHRGDLGVELLTRVTGLGRTQLYEKFRDHHLSSPAQYIRDVRITKAKHLLRSTELPVSQIAFAVGFEDPLYFSRVFSKLIEKSPTEYRKWHHSGDSKK